MRVPCIEHESQHLLPAAHIHKQPVEDVGLLGHIVGSSICVVCVGSSAAQQSVQPLVKMLRVQGTHTTTDSYTSHNATDSYTSHNATNSYTSHDATATTDLYTSHNATESYTSHNATDSYTSHPTRPTQPTCILHTMRLTRIFYTTRPTRRRAWRCSNDSVL